MSLPNCDCGACCESCGHEPNCARNERTSMGRKERVAARVAQIRLSQYREARFAVATYGSGSERALHEIASTLSAELDRVRSEAGRALQLLMAAEGMEAALILDAIGVEDNGAGRAE